MTSCRAWVLWAFRGKGGKEKSIFASLLGRPSRTWLLGFISNPSRIEQRPDQNGAKAKRDGCKDRRRDTGKSGVLGVFGGIPGSVGSARYHRRASPASRHPAEPWQWPSIQRLHCRRSTRDNTRIQGFGADVSTSCGPPITDRGRGVTGRREGGYSFSLGDILDRLLDKMATVVIKC